FGFLSSFVIRHSEFANPPTSPPPAHTEGSPMDTSSLTQIPFAVVTFIVAPALLTNSSSLLAMSTINRMLRTRERMRDLFTKSQATAEPEAAWFTSQVDRVEQQAILLLRALHA